MKVLVLNADYTPYDIWTWKKAMHKWLGEKAVIPIESSNKIIRSGNNKEWFIPSILLLKKYIKTKDKKAPYSKKRVYNRDRHMCQYCGLKLQPSQKTIDHVIPKSMWINKKIAGTPNCYSNVVTACLRCNAHKANKTPDQAKMPLLKEPKDLTYNQAFINEILVNDIQREWWPYLERYITSY